MIKKRKLAEPALRERVIKEARVYYENVFKRKKNIQGRRFHSLRGRVFDRDEIENLIESSLDFGLPPAGSPTI